MKVTYKNFKEKNNLNENRRYFNQANTTKEFLNAWNSFKMNVREEDIESLLKDFDAVLDLIDSYKKNASKNKETFSDMQIRELKKLENVINNVYESMEDVYSGYREALRLVSHEIFY